MSARAALISVVSGVFAIAGVGGAGLPSAHATDGSAWQTARATMRASQQALAIVGRGSDVKHGGHETRDLDSLSDTDAWAVGRQGVRDSGWARHWDGTAWTAVPTPVIDEAEFEGVSMLGSDDGWAVGSWNAPQGGGFGGTLAEHWNGAKWTYVESFETGGFSIFEAVAANSPDDVWAVGATSRPKPHPLVEHWDGTTWSEVAESAPEGEGIYSAFYGITVIDADDIYAVGDVDDHNVRRPLIEHWDGTSWQVVDTGLPDKTVLLGVDATGPDDVWAVGYHTYYERARCCIEYYHGVITHFDGTVWTKATTGRQPARTTSFSDVAAVAPGNAWVVGTESTESSQATTEHWNGRAWKRIDTTQSPFPSNYLNAVTSSGSDFVMAGGYDSAGGPHRCLTLLWNGRTWTWVDRHRSPRLPRS